MKVKIVINTIDKEPTDDLQLRHRTSLVWEGELEIKDDQEYLTKISIIGEGQPQPLCDIPFAIGIGYYQWVPPTTLQQEEVETDGYL